ncbi:TPA: hypothetical protein ACMD15_003430 [Vibrio cholerae]
MSVILPAKVKDGQLYINDVLADDVEIMGIGEKDSTGFVLFGREKSIYIIDTQPDLKELISKLIGVIENVISIASQDVVKQVTGGSGAPAVGITLPLDIEAQSKLEQIKSQLEGFKLL